MKPIRSLFSLVVYLSVAHLIIGCGSTRSHPSDQVLEQRLRSHQADFDNLVSMLNQDSDVVRIGPKSVFLKEGSGRELSKERVDEYRQLFKEVELEAGIHRDGVGVVRLIASTDGLLVPNSEKSYVYSPTAPSPLVESIDHIIESNHGDQSPVYKKLYGNWYLYYESW
jgi:hypothetical protein